MSSKQKVIAFILLYFGLYVSPSFASAKLNVVVTTTDLASITKEIGREWIAVTTICKGDQDPHYVPARPSYMVLLNRADLLVLNGVELEVGWLPNLIQGSRNPKIMLGQPGHLNMSEGVDEILEIPVGTVDRSMGDIHPFGNPHYTLDPKNAIALGVLVANRLSQLDPDHKNQYHANAKEFEKTMTTMLAQWLSELEFLKGAKIITYHRLWSYFLDRFNIEYAGIIEVRPGIFPSSSHLSTLTTVMKNLKYKFILNANFNDPRFSELLAEKTGGHVLVVPGQTLGVGEAKDYIHFIDHLVKEIVRVSKGFSRDKKE